MSKEKCVFLITIAVLSTLLLPTFVNAQNEVRFILGTTSVLSLNPMTSYDYGLFRSAIYSQLFIQNATLQPEPWLALSYSKPNDTTWVVKLRQNATWHDGQPVTSQDVRFTINLVQQAGGAMARFVQGISSVETPDNYTLVVKTAHPTLIAGWLTGLLVLPEHYWVAHGAVGAAALNFTNDPPLGSGPFQFVDWQPGEYIEFQAFDNFFMGRPKIDSLVIRQYASQEGLNAALKSGEIDAADYVPLSDVRSLQQVPGLGIVQSQMNAVEDIYINLHTNASQGNPTLLDKNVRLALMYAINRTYLNDELYLGLYHPALSIIPSVFGAYYCQECESMLPQFNLTKANQILDDAGYKKGSDGIRVSPSGVKLVYRFYIFNGYPEMVRGAQIIRQWWNQIGVDITYSVMEGGTLWSTISSPPYNWDMAVWNWLVNDPSSMIYSYTSAAVGAGYSSSGLAEPSVDAMYHTIISTTNQTQQISSVHDVQKYILQNAVEIDLFYMTFVSAYWANKWAGLVPEPGSALYVLGPNSLMYLYIQAQVAATTSSTAPSTNSTAATPGASPGLTPAVVLVIILVLAAAIYMRRRASLNAAEKKQNGSNSKRRL